MVFRSMEQNISCTVTAKCLVLSFQLWMQTCWGLIESPQNGVSPIISLIMALIAAPPTLRSDSNIPLHILGANLAGGWMIFNFIILDVWLLWEAIYFIECFLYHTAYKSRMQTIQVAIHQANWSHNKCLYTAFCRPTVIFAFGFTCDEKEVLFSRYMSEKDAVL